MAYCPTHSVEDRWADFHLALPFDLPHRHFHWGGVSKGSCKVFSPLLPTARYTQRGAGENEAEITIAGMRRNREHENKRMREEKMQRNNERGNKRE